MKKLKVEVEYCSGKDNNGDVIQNILLWLKECPYVIKDLKVKDVGC